MTYVIVKVGEACDVEAVVVRPLLVIGFLAIDANVSSIVDLECILLIEHRTREPFPLLLGPVHKSVVVANVSCKLRGEEEESTICSNVLVIVSVVECKHLPSQTTIAVVVPSACLSVEH